ncbi:hypothetical protein [Actinospica robiniae]|uniref:hypothetical protein n=1 Tax=Actinospica robiniae TaxID=304901 RepID=UPI000422764E|nr:hypothetical protein [Actinospica robiniae]
MPQRWNAPGESAITWMWPGQSTEDLGLLVITGGKLHRWPVPGAHRYVVEAFDVDEDAGVAVALIVTLPRRGAGTSRQETYEYEPSRGWIALGGGAFSPADRALARTRPSAARSGPAVMISTNGASSTRSYVERLRRSEAGRPLSLGTVSWVSTGVIEVSVEVDHLLFSGRRISVPDHGRCVVTWKSPAPTTTTRPTLPRIAAADRDGRILTELGPDNTLDTFTQAFLDELTAPG